MVTILLGEGFEESEALVPADLLRRAGIETQMAGLDSLQVTGGHGITVTADILLSHVRLEQTELLILPGGMGGVTAIRGNVHALDLIRDTARRGIWLAAICAAPTILAELGLLEGRRAVCYPGMEDEMAGAVVQTGSPVVVDGHIVTAEAAGSAFQFGLTLIECLRDRTTAQEVCNDVFFHG